MRAGYLEQSCGDWVACDPALDGVQRLQAWFGATGFARHRHDTYAIGLTDAGVQSFWYRGSVHASTPGEVIVLHPDEPHDGYAGTRHGFGYRIVYVHPARVAEASRAIVGRVCALPFVARPVIQSPALRDSIAAAFTREWAPLAVDALVLSLTEALLLESAGPAAAKTCPDRRAVKRARQLLDSETHRLVRSSELETASGLSRFELARQFREQVGTSPYRYSLMRRLECARIHIGTRPLAEVALETGFADQAHFTRAFGAAFGITPGRYAALKSSAPKPRSSIPARTDG